jgi:glycosyltransferase involved in cell wall biosynthesis
MRNAQHTIADCLQALAEQSVLPDEVIIIENNSTDASYTTVVEASKKYQHLNICITVEKKPGPAAARNSGIALANSEILAFTDADCIPFQHWIKNIKAHFTRDTELQVLGGVESGATIATSLIGTMLAISWLPTRDRQKQSVIAEKAEFFSGKFVATFNCAARRDIIQKVDGFDEGFVPAGEDSDLWLRILETNARIVVWVPDIVVTHNQNISLTALVRKMFYYGQAVARLTRRHFYHQIIWRQHGGRYYHRQVPFATLVTYSNVNLSLVTLCIAVLAFSGIVSFHVLLFAALITGLYLSIKLRNRLKNSGYRISTHRIVLIGLFYLAKKFTQEIGLLTGSIRYKVICL